MLTAMRAHEAFQSFFETQDGVTRTKFARLQNSEQRAWQAVVDAILSVEEYEAMEDKIAELEETIHAMETVND